MEKLKQIIIKKEVSKIRKYILSIPFNEVVENVEKLNAINIHYFLVSLKPSDQSKFISIFSKNIQKQIIELFSINQIEKFIKFFHSEQIVNLIEDLPKNISSKILDALPAIRKKEIIKILNYSEDIVGSIMSTDIVTFKKTWTIGKTLNIIKNNIDEIHFSQYFYIVDNKNKLVGYIKMKDIIFEQRQKTLTNFMKPAIPIKTITDKEEAAQIFAKYNMQSLPVVNYANEVVGIITADSVIDVIQEEVNEDFQVMAGIKTTEEPYSNTKIFKLFKSRVMWLLLLMISSTLSQIVLDSFLNLSGSKLNEDISDVAIVGITSAIVAILPVISGVAGNAGSQSSTTIIRSLATNDISTKDYLKVFGKEIKTSTLIGLVLGISNFVRLVIYYSVTGDISKEKYLFLSFAASISLMIVVILAQVVGSILPLIAKTFKIDPAVMAAPVLTTLIDALSIVIFFSISIGIMLLVI